MLPTTTRSRGLAAALGAVLTVLAGASGAHAAVPLTASFDAAPGTPARGQLVELTATTTGGSTAPIQHTWDLDGDGAFDDATGAKTRTRFDEPGTHVVRLRAAQGSLGPAIVSVAERTFVIEAPGTPAPQPPAAQPDPQPEPPAPQPDPPAADPPATDGNQPPTARYDRRCTKVGVMAWCPGLQVVEDEEATLGATGSSDPDGQIVRYEWDLDGDGTFERDAGASPTIEHTFGPPVRRSLTDDGRDQAIAVRVTDDRGATAEERVTLRIAAPRCRRSFSRAQVFTAQSTCLRPYHRTAGGVDVTRWVSKHPVMLNGIAIAPAKGRTIVLDVPKGAGGVHLTSNRATVSMAARGVPTVVRTGPLDWRIGDGRIKGFQLDRDAKLNGLRITLADTPTIGLGRASAPVHIALPADFGAASSAKPIVLGHQGGARAAQTGPLSFEVPEAAFGPFGLKRLRVSFDGEDLWEVAASIALPAPADVTIEGDAGIRSDGAFHHAGASVDFGRGIPIGGPIPVHLKRIAFRIEVKPKKSRCVPYVGVIDNPVQVGFDIPGWPKKLDFGIPTFAMCGEVSLTAGPTVLGAAAMRLDAGLGLATYADRPWVLRANGKLHVVEIPLAEASVAVHGDGYFRAGGKVRWAAGSWFSITGGLSLEMWRGRFNASASGDACIDFVDLCAGFRGVVSTKGVAVCLKIDLWVTDWSPGIGYKWGASFPDLYFSGCDIGRYKEHLGSRPSRAYAAQAGGGEHAIDLPAGLPGAVIAAEGRGAAPKITIVGPRGERIATPDGPEAVKAETHLLLKDPRSKTTQVAIPKPSAGRWRVVVEEGSVPLVRLRSAEGLPAPEVDARVEGTGARRTLRYDIADRPGQRVTFVERGPSAGGLLGVAKGARGTLRFTPAPGAADRRRVVAIVEQDGVVREELDVAGYRAPRAAKPARPGRLRVRGTSVRWTKVPGAASYRLRARVQGGRTVVRTVPRTAVRLPRRAAGRVEVRAVTAAGLVGRPAAARG